jgi:hypothetical protein
MKGEKIVKEINDMKENKFESLLKRIGCGLSHLRIHKGYETIKHFALDHNLPLIQYWRIEKGRANVTLKSLLTLLAIHKVNLEDFFSLIRSRCY